MTPFFSPDNAWIAFSKDGALFRAAVSGGAPLRICSNCGGFASGADWSGDEVVLTLGFAGLHRVPAAGGEPQVLTALDRERREKSHRFPQVLPGGDTVLFTLATSTTDSWDDASIAVASMKTGEYKVVLEGGTYARYSLTGHLLYVRGGSLHAVSFDPRTLEVTGEPALVLPQVMTTPVVGTAEFALTENGSLLYAPGRSSTFSSRVLSVDRDGRVETLLETPRSLIDLSLSPDGRRLALEVGGGALESLWLYEIDRGTWTRWTSEWDNFHPVWAPSGREIAFASARASGGNLYKRAVDGVEEAEQLGTGSTPASWSPDGEVLAYNAEAAETGADVWTLRLSGDRKPEPFLNGRANEGWPAFSPDGRWVAYQSDETGELEIYLQRFPDGGGIRPVSTGGGSYPGWNPNGKELFYRSGDKMMAVAVRTERDLVLGRPVALVEIRNPQRVSDSFAVTPDGQRFLFIERDVPEPTPSHLVLVQNFGEELKRLVPQRK
jgi:serine/threonine-protein kinase